MASVEQPTVEQPAGPDEIRVENPATGEFVAAVPRIAPEAVSGLVARARAVQPAWEALGFAGRANVLRRAQKWVVDNSDRIARTIVSETGKTYDDALMAEIGYVAAAFGFWAKHAPRFLADEKVRTSSPFLVGRRLVVRYRPLGVIGVIGPWNYPLTNSFGDCIPALAAGNAAVLKPSQSTPLTSLLMADALRECGLPDDVYLVAAGDGATGEALIDEVDMIMFTGSTAVGKRVMERAARTLTPVSLELGGKDPMIVLADADVERAANSAVHASMQNGGQTCVSIERVYVEAPIYDDFVDRVARKVSALRQGVPDGPGSVDVGAMTFAPQLDIVSRHVEEARKAGARVLTGGRASQERGRFYAPTVLADVDHSMSCMTEETFGPTVAIMRVRDADEAVRLANDSPYGLAASVFGKDVARAEQVARRIEAGAACINDAQINYFALELPMGGWKQSGLGVRHGAPGIRKYCRQQSLLITRFASRRELHMFPYRARTTRLIAKALRLLYGRGRRD
jgi:acyl-CoA reductase-like NAD-dependent aldehyde dehydrogenase